MDLTSALLLAGAVLASPLIYGTVAWARQEPERAAFYGLALLLFPVITVQLWWRRP